MRGKILRAIVLGCLVVVASRATAQGRVWPEKKNFLVLGEAVGSGSGGLFSGTTLMQVMRVGGVVTIKSPNAIDFSAVRLQTFLPPRGTVNDYEFANPEADALIVSFAQLTSSRAKGIPSEIAIGGGVARRNTSEAGRTRDTWIGHFGFDANPFVRWPHSDAAVGFHIYLMPTNTSSLVYIASLGLALRIG